MTALYKRMDGWMFLNNVGSVEEAIKRVCVCVWEKEGMVKDPGAVQHRACSVHGFELKQLDRHFAFVCRSHSKAFFFF